MADGPPTTSSGPSGTLLTPPFVLVTLATFAYFTCLGALLPIVPLYVEEELNGNGLAVGVAAGAFAVSAALLRPAMGRLGDRRGRRFLVVGGSLAVALSVASYTLASSLPVLVGLRLLTGVGEAAMWIGAATAAQDMAPDDRRGEAASYFSVALYAGLAVGPFLGERLARAASFDAVWLVAAGCALVACAFGLGTPPGERQLERRSARGLHPAAVGPGLVLFLGLIPFTGFATFLAVYGPDVGIQDVGPVFATYAGLVLVIRIFAARLPDRLGWRMASTGALVAVTAAGLVIGAFAEAAAVWIGAILLALGMSLLFPALFSAAVAAAPESERGEAVGTFSLFFDLSQGLGAPVLGGVVNLTSYRGAFLASAAVSATGFLAQRSLHGRSVRLSMDDPEFGHA